MGTTAELIVLVALLSAGTSCSVEQVEPGIPLTFEGSSRDLKATEVVPTLDTRIPEGKNAIWCASFQSAWKALEELAGGPIGFSEMPAMAGQLNEAADPRPHIPPAALYTASGWNQRGITNQIWRDLRQRFPDRTPPAFPGITPDSFVAYACLEANGWTSPNRISGSASTEAEPLCAQKRRTLRQRFPPASASTGRFWCI